ncbi:MAG: hypothetical protein ACP5JG_18890 [Anaerolineae bacterium]
MESPQIRFARLDKEKMARLKELEEALGTYVLAFEPLIKIADLTEEQLSMLQKVEEEMGVILVAYEDA